MTISSKRLGLVGFLVLGMLSLGAAAQDHGHGRGQGNGHHFDSHDRGEVHAWQERHHEHPPAGFRDQDRLPPEMESRLRVGFVMGPEFRRRIRPVPHDLLITLEPPPRHYRYVVIGDHLCLVDSGYRVEDVLHLELSF